MQKTYLFYDIETSGLNKAFDQVLQFAAIRTDLDFNELERHELQVKLNPDVIPAPQAILAHKISVHDMQQGISEFEAIKKIHQWVNQPGTISLGYNTLDFDDEFLRFSFYRNLLPPYTHQYANACGRMDIYPMLVMYYLFKNNMLIWSKRNEKNSFKLEDLNAVNQFAEGKAHNAMVDTGVTLALARRLKQDAAMWQYLQTCFDKATDLARMHSLKNEMALLIDGAIGSAAFYQCPVMFLGFHQIYKNKLIWLRLDQAGLEQQPVEKIYVIGKKAGEPNFILPFKERFTCHLTDERRIQAENNKLFLEKNPELLQKITEYHCSYQYPDYPEADVESVLYTRGF